MSLLQVESRASIGHEREFNLYLYATVNRRKRKAIPSEVRLIVLRNAVIFTDFHQNLRSKYAYIATANKNGIYYIHYFLYIYILTIMALSLVTFIFTGKIEWINHLIV